MRKFFAYILFGMMLALASAGTIYKWTDERGNVHYSDQPIGGKKALTLEVQSPSTHPYPPPGSPDPGPACQRDARPKWLEFFCNFMTQDIWIAGGRQKFLANTAQPDWIPFFSPESGLIEGLAQTGSGGSKVKQKYTPWSLHFKETMHCRKEQKVDPYIFRHTQRFRGDLLGLNWNEVSKDATDPTSGFEEGAMFMLFTLADFKESHKERTTASLSTLLFNIASGEGSFRPDYQRDGEVSLVKPDGTVMRLDSLDSAAQYMQETQWLFTNDFMKTWGEAVQDAQLLSANKARPLVHIYMAQDILTLPWANNTTYRKRLEYLIKKAATLSAGTRKIAVMSHGWSGHIVGAAVFSYPNVFEHSSMGPSPGPWNFAEYLRVLQSTQVKTSILVGQYDFVSLLGGGAAYKTKDLRACVPPSEVDRATGARQPSP